MANRRLQRRGLGRRTGATGLRRRRRSDGDLVRHEPHEPAHHLLLQASVHRDESGRVLHAEPSLRPRRRRGDLPERDRGGPLEPAGGNDQLHHAGHDGDRQRGRIRLEFGPARSVASRRRHQHDRGRDPPAVGGEQRRQLRSGARRHRGPGRAADREPAVACRRRHHQLGERHVQGHGQRGGRARQRHALRRRPAAVGGLQRAGAGRGRADHRRHTDRCQRRAARRSMSTARPRTPTAC